jgi:sugar transferase (PEP-CTERM/EpsH1 system associated)
MNVSWSRSLPGDTVSEPTVLGGALGTTSVACHLNGQARCGSGDRGPLRVLHVIHRLWRGGMEYGILKLFKALDPRTFEQRVCTLCGTDSALADLQPLTDGLVVAGDIRDRRFAVWRLFKVMRKLRPHIVHSRNWGAIEAVAAAKLAQVPVVIHSEHGYELDMLHGLPVRRRLMRRFFYGATDSFFTVSEDLRRFHSGEAWFPADRVLVIPNGVDTRRFAPSAELRLAERQKLGLSKGVFTVGCVGRMIPLKDHDTVIRAAEILVQRGIDVHLLFVGSGPELGSLQQRVAGSATLRGRVSFCGAVENIAPLLNAMDVLVQASICEGMSNTILEAMSTGVPVVATDVGGNPEVVEEGVCGLLFHPRDAQGLAARIERLVHNSILRDHFCRAARERVVERFNLEHMLNQYSDLHLTCAWRRGLLEQAAESLQGNSRVF